MGNEHEAYEPAVDQEDVTVLTTETGRDEYRIVATATLDSPADEVWALLLNWERLVEVGLPGLTSDFRWLTGGPDDVPSTFRFELAGAILEEEIYERTVEMETSRYRLRYRALEPALGVLEYDALLELREIDETRTAFSATRDVRLAPGSPPDMLAEIVESETRCLVDHFGAGNAG